MGADTVQTMSRFFTPAHSPLLVPGTEKRILRRPDFRNLIVPRLSGAPLHTDQVDYDDLVIHRTYRSFDPTRPAEVRYLMYELSQKLPGEDAYTYYWKAIRLARVTRVPRYLRRSTSSGPNMVFEQQRDILAALREQQVLFLNVIAKSASLPMIFAYGVQGVGESPEEAQRLADEGWAVMEGQLNGVFQQLEYAQLTMEQAETIVRYQSEWDHIAMARGRPVPAGGNFGAANLFDGNRTEVESTLNQLESFLRGMSDREFMLSLVTVPVSPTEMMTAWRNISTKLSQIRSEQQGTRSLTAGVAIPLSMGQSLANTTGNAHSIGASQGVGQSAGVSHTDTTGHSLTDTQGLSQTATHGTSAGVSQGTSQGQTVGSNTGLTGTTSHNAGTSTGVSDGTTTGHSVGQSSGQSLTNTQGQSLGQTSGQSTSQTDTQSVGQSVGHSVGASAGQSVSAGVGSTTGLSQSGSTSLGQSLSAGSSTGTAFSNSLNQTFGSSVHGGLGILGGGQSTGSGQGQTAGSTAGNSLGTSLNGGISQSTGISQAQSQSLGQGASWGTNVTDNAGQSVGASAAQSVGQSVSQTAGASVSQSLGANVGQSVGQSVGTSAGLSQGISDGVAQGLALSHGATSAASTSASQGTSQGTSDSQAQSQSVSQAQGTSQSAAAGTSSGTSANQGLADGTSTNFAQATAATAAIGVVPSVGVSVSRSVFDESKRILGDVIEAQTRRYLEGIEGGAFLYQMFLTCPDRATLLTAAGLLKSSFWGLGTHEHRLPQPFHTVTDFEQGEAERLLLHGRAFTHYRLREPQVELIEPHFYSSYVTTMEAAAFCHPPTNESLGLMGMVDSMPVLTMPANRQKRDIRLGRIINGERARVTETGFGIDVDEITHTLVAGTTGIGKTTTLMTMLAEISRVERTFVERPTIDDPLPRSRKVRAGILGLDWMSNMRDLGSVVGPDRFRFFSIAKPELGEFRWNPLAVPDDGMDPVEWASDMSDNMTISFNLGEFGRSIIAELLSDLYSANRLEPYALRLEARDPNTGVVLREGAYLPPVDRATLPAGAIQIGVDGTEIANVLTCPGLSRLISMADLATLVLNKVEEAATVEGARLHGPAFRDRIQSLWRRVQYFAPGSMFATVFACDERLDVRTTLSVSDLIDPDLGLVTIIEADGLDLTNRRFILGSVLLAVWRFGQHKGAGSFDHNRQGPGTFVCLEEAHELFGEQGRDEDAFSAATRTSLYESMFRRARALGMKLVAVVQNCGSIPSAVTSNTTTVMIHRQYDDNDRKRAFSLLNWDHMLAAQLREWRYLGEMPMGYLIVRLDAKESYLESAPVQIRVDPAALSRVTDHELEALASARTL